MTTVTICSDFGVQKNKVWHCFHCFPIYLPWSDVTRCHDLKLSLSFKPTFSLSSFIFIKRLFSSFSLSAIRVCHLHLWGYWYFSWQSWFQLVLHPAWHFTWCTLHRSEISRVTIYSLDVLLSWFGTSLLFHVQFCFFWPAYIFSRGRSGGLVFPSLSEFSTVYCDPHSQRLCRSQWSRSRCLSGTLLHLPIH